ncbi:MAG: hypothetical protein H6718_24375 [Polyangiaceae bacterium]|nr:hypothetical protein [Myxococcales bacterium]MCB9588568.1 hypothetical protein [Polyangiaceae bacterium]
MLRPLAVIIAAMYLTRPGIPYPEAERYAKVIQAEAKSRDFDPLSAVAIVHFETGFFPELVSENGEDYGLGQIRARYIGACKLDDDPVNHPSDECKAVKSQLLEGEENLRWVAKLITRNRKFCKEKTGSALFQQWLASYQGLNFPKQNRWCQPKKKTWRVVKYHASLKQELLAGGKLKKKHRDLVEQKRKEAQAERAKEPEQPKKAPPPQEKPPSKGKGKQNAALQSKSSLLMRVTLL